MIEKLFDENLIKIGLIRIGGLGDSLNLLFLSSAVREKYSNSIITLYIRDSYKCFYNHRGIDKLVVCKKKDPEEVLNLALEDNDIVYDNRYQTGIYKEKKLINKDKLDHRYFQFWKNLDLSFSENLVDLMFSTAEIQKKEKYFDLNSLILNDKFERVLTRPYIIVHNCYDKVRATKAWENKNWNILVWLIKNFYSYYNVIQLGAKREPRILDTIDLRGKTTLEETASIIRGAKLLIDTEGGLVHLARGLQTKSVVLFGPTPKECFGYSKNINIQIDKCKNCWYTKDNWWSICPKKNTEHCLSLYKISPTFVFERVKNLL